MEGICYSIYSLYKAMPDCCKKNDYCKIALYDFVSDTAFEMWLIFMPDDGSSWEAWNGALF